jgi:hypothetical protein
VIYDGLVLFEEPRHGLPAGQPKQRTLDPSVVHTAPDLSTARLSPEQRNVPLIGPLLSQKASPPQHAGRDANLAQRRHGDPTALRPRGSHLQERLLELRESGCLVDLCVGGP